jgi:hypothetical protein
VTGTLEDALADAMLRGTLVPGDSLLAKLSAAAAAEAAAGRAPLLGPAAVRACSFRRFTAPLRTLHDLNCLLMCTSHKGWRPCQHTARMGRLYWW